MNSRITPFLWFDGEAEEAANFYVSIFKGSRITAIARYGEAGPGKPGTAMTVGFELEGQAYTALNGGPHFKFNEAISFVVHCQTQEEVDYYWDHLLAGGVASQCGWLKDRYGLSWQIVPDVLLELTQDQNPRKSQNVMRAMMQMVKIDIAQLRQAYDAE